ncbi:MAG: FG-GAP-like repeat-containing protein, partial [Bifidobacteriaceae bacterium]|nr:FG-GAP-like repeat-containing protein [Bifidobacteriaceae bacterium]
LQDNLITSLDGLQKLTKLKTLLLSNENGTDKNGVAGTYANAITDISPLEGLTALETLDLGTVDSYTSAHPAGVINKVSDLSPLANLTSLKALNFRNNNLSDLTPLAGLTGLTGLYFTHNNITDLSPLKDTTQLTYFGAQYNQITDLSPLAGNVHINRIDADKNQITSVEPLADLDSITILGVSWNNIEDLSPLAGLTTLTQLAVSKNPTGDLTPLAGLTNLKYLAAYGMLVSDVTPLLSLTKLSTGLALDQNRILDASPLAALSITDGSLMLDHQVVPVSLVKEIGEAGVTYTVDDMGLKSRNGKAVALSTDALCSATTVAQVDVPNTKGVNTFYFCSEDQKFSGTVTVTVSRPPIEGKKPVIEGVAEVGETLTAKPGEWTPAPVDLAYQWLRDGVVIDGATGSTYLVASGDLDAKLSVKVTGSKAERDDVTLTSDPTVAVTQPREDPFALRYESFTLSPDLTGDGKGEALAIQASDGALHLYPSKGDGTLQPLKVLVQSGLKGSRVFGPGDWDGDKKSDVITVDQAGAMWLYKGNNHGGIGTKVQNGRGWSPYRIVPAGDLNRDGANDMLAIDEDGLLWLYAGNGQGGFIKGRTQVGHGWKGFDLYSAADLNKDGKVDILSISSKGLLYAYFGRGDGHFQMPVQVGKGWGQFTLAAGGDLNGDSLADIVGRNDTNGTLYYYQSKGAGQFAYPKLADTGW